jgi:hypothetical protein
LCNRACGSPQGAIEDDRVRIEEDHGVSEPAPECVPEANERANDVGLVPLSSGADVGKGESPVVCRGEFFQERGDARGEPKASTRTTRAELSCVDRV